MGMVMVIDVVRKSLSSLTYPHKYVVTLQVSSNLTLSRIRVNLHPVSAPDYWVI